MKLMHTKLPEFIQRLQDAAVRHTPEMKMEIKGMENVHSAKLQSLRTGRIANAVEEIACTQGIDHIEVLVLPRMPETMHTLVSSDVCSSDLIRTAKPKRPLWKRLICWFPPRSWICSIVKRSSTEDQK